MPDLEPIALEAPACFEAALGYRRQTARRVAFYWIPQARAVSFEDNEGCSGLLDAGGWTTLMGHPLAELIFPHAPFGSPGEEASQWLLLDRMSRELFAGSPETVRALLRPVLPEAAGARLLDETLFYRLAGRRPEGPLWTLPNLEDGAHPGRSCFRASAYERRERALAAELEAWLDARLLELVTRLELYPDLTEIERRWIARARAHLRSEDHPIE